MFSSFNGRIPKVHMKERKEVGKDDSGGDDLMEEVSASGGRVTEAMDMENSLGVQ